MHFASRLKIGERGLLVCWDLKCDKISVLYQLHIWTLLSGIMWLPLAKVSIAGCSYSYYGNSLGCRKSQDNTFPGTMECPTAPLSQRSWWLFREVSALGIQKRSQLMEPEKSRKEWESYNTYRNPQIMRWEKDFTSLSLTTLGNCSFFLEQNHPIRTFSADITICWQLWGQHNQASFDTAKSWRIKYMCQTCCLKTKTT